MAWNESVKNFLKKRINTELQYLFEHRSWERNVNTFSHHFNTNGKQT